MRLFSVVYGPNWIVPQSRSKALKHFGIVCPRIADYFPSLAHNPNRTHHNEETNRLLISARPSPEMPACHPSRTPPQVVFLGKMPVKTALLYSPM